MSKLISSMRVARILKLRSTSNINILLIYKSLNESRIILSFSIDISFLNDSILTLLLRSNSAVNCLLHAIELHKNEHS